MSTVSEAVASKLLQKEQNKMQKCFRCKEAGFPNKLIGFEKILLGVREYGNHSNRCNWRAENVNSTFHLNLEVNDLVSHSREGYTTKNLRQVLGSAYHIEHAKTLTY